MNTITHDNKEFTKAAKGKGYYYVCKDTGEVLSLMRPNFPKILKPSINGNGYYMVGFFTKKDRINVNIHRLLMETFVPNTNNDAHINHIDGNKLNNTLTNLEWCTPAHNTKHAHATGLATTTHCEVAVHSYDLTGNYLCSYPSLHAAGRALSMNPSSIHAALSGKSHTCDNKQWSYSLVDTIPPYTGFDLIKEYILLASDPMSTYTYTKLKDVTNHTGWSRALVHRRFAKYGNTFTEGNFTLTKIVHT